MSNLLVQAPPDIGTVTTYYDQPNNIRAVQKNGRLEFWFDAELVFRIILDTRDEGLAQGYNGFWTPYYIRSESVSGAGSGPVEVVSVTSAFVVAMDVRRMEFDKTADEISIVFGNSDPDDLIESRSSTPIDELDFHTVFQVFDPGINDYRTAASLSHDGTFTLHNQVPIRTVALGSIPS